MRYVCPSAPNRSLISLSENDEAKKLTTNVNGRRIPMKKRLKPLAQANILCDLAELSTAMALSTLAPISLQSLSRAFKVF